MKILLLGGTGLIGRALCTELLADGQQITVLSRQTPERVRQLCGAVTTIANLSQLTPTDHFDAVINLAGEPIADARWTASRKAVLHASRIGVTRELLDYLEKAETRPEVLLNGSAVGYYGNQGDLPLGETSPTQDDYSHQLCAQWEATALEATQLGIRVCLLRTGLVLARNGGFLKKMLPLFRLGLGGAIGDGRQWMSWIHVHDHIAIQKRLLTHPKLSGPYNLTAPHPVTNTEFTQTLAQVLNRPALLPMPAWLLKLALGEMSELLLGGQRAHPVNIIQAGQKFRFKSLEEGLRDVV